MPDKNKYLFDLHNFDSGAGFDPENPPAPTFTEEEINQARAQGYADGLAKGLADAKASRDQQVLEIINRLTSDLKILINGEQIRTKKFEHELVTLVHHLYQKTFPILNDTYGLPQIQSTLQNILTQIQDHASVTIMVNPQDIDDLGQRLKPFLSTHEKDVILLAQSDISPGSFAMKWKDGGAVRDIQALAQQLSDGIAQHLKFSDQDPIN